MRFITKATQALKTVLKKKELGDSLPFIDVKDEFYRNIPIFINNRDLLAWPRMMIDKLSALGFQRIVVLDNDSAYPPLLDYYKKTTARVVRLGKNHGFRALYNAGILNENEYLGQMYVYSDPDCVFLDNCPSDFIKQFHRILVKHSEIPKVGFSLTGWNWAYHQWEVEKGYFSKKVGDYAYLTPVDTTFALYRAESRSYVVGGFRTTRPYLCRHIAWEFQHLSVDELPEDFVVYIARADSGSSIARLYHKNPDFVDSKRVQKIRERFV